MKKINLSFLLTVMLMTTMAAAQQSGTRTPDNKGRIRTEAPLKSGRPRTINHKEESYGVVKNTTTTRDHKGRYVVNGSGGSAVGQATQGLRQANPYNAEGGEMAHKVSNEQPKYGSRQYDDRPHAYPNGDKTYAATMEQPGQSDAQVEAGAEGHEGRDVTSSNNAPKDDRPTQVNNRR